MSSPPSSPFSFPLPIRLFVTGGSGYVGHNLIRHFTAQGVQVVALTRSADARRVVQELGAQPFDGDLFSPELSMAMAGCQALVHTAADTDHGLPTPAQYRTNVEGTRLVLEAARQAGIHRVVHLSTESVLLDGRPLVHANEDHPYPKRSAGGYSASKKVAESIALSASRENFDVMVVRPRFVWGRDDSTALPQLLTAVDQGQFAWMDGGHYRTSTTHIANLIHGIERTLIAGAPGEAYFITDSDTVEFRSFISELISSQGRPLPTKEVPGWLVSGVATVSAWIAHLSGGRWTPPVTRQALATSAVEVTLDIGKARRDLGYAPPISRAEGLAELQVPRAPRRPPGIE